MSDHRGSHIAGRRARRRLAPAGRLGAGARRRAARARRRRPARGAHPRAERARARAGARREPRHGVARLRPAARGRLPRQRARRRELAHAAGRASAGGADAVRAAPAWGVDLSIAALPGARAAARRGRRQRRAGARPPRRRRTATPPPGCRELRAAIAARFCERGVPTTADQVLVTAGAQHALHLVLRLLCAPGDRVLVDAPAYPRTLAARARRARPAGRGAARRRAAGTSAPGSRRSPRPPAAPRGHDARLPQPDRAHRWRDAQRQAIAPACASAGVPLVTDETSAELRLDGPPRRPPLGRLRPGRRGVTRRLDEQGGVGRPAARLDPRRAARWCASWRRSAPTSTWPARCSSSCSASSCSRAGTRCVASRARAAARAPRRAAGRARRGRAGVVGAPPPRRPERVGAAARPGGHAARRRPPRARASS